MTIMTHPFDCAAFIEQARARGVLVTARQGAVSLWGPPEAVEDDAFLAAVRANKEALLAYLDSRGTGAAVPAAEVTPRPDLAGEPFPLTDIQRAYWVGRQEAFDLGDVAIHFYTEVECRDLDVQRLQDAWNRTVRRHGMLRAVVDDQGRQRILPEVPPYVVEVTDLAGLDAAAREAALAARREAMSHRVHRTDAWPGFELALAHLGGGHYRLAYSQDLLHIDGGSLLLVLEDLSRFYTDPAAEPPVPALTFRDYVDHEAARKETAEFQADLAYWQDEVQALPAAPQLPRRPGRRRSGRFVRNAFLIDAAGYETLKRRSAAVNVTPTGYVMAAFASVLAQWNGGRDFSLNVTLFNRPPIHPDIGRIAGDFTSMVPVAVRPRAGQPFAETARGMQKDLWRHLGHRTVSGVTILDLLRKAAGRHEAADLSVVYTSLLNLDGQGFSSGYLSALGESVYTITQTPQVTLDHQVAPMPCGGLAFTWDFVADHFPDGMIADMFAAYEAFVRALVAEGADLHDRPPPSHLPAAQESLFAAVNDTGAAWPAGQTLRDLFEAQVAARPDHPALRAGSLDLSYAALAAAARGLAARLAEAGARPGDRIGVCMDKGWGQVAAVLAIHQAGGAYVPLDPDNPPARTAHICADAGLAVVLVDAGGEDRLAGTAARPLAVTAEILDAPPPTAFLPAPLRPADVSHVIYTSGSTGLPKGVVVEHRNVVNRVADIAGRFAIGPQDAVLGLTALHHDLSVFDIFGILAAGATLVLPDADSRLDPAHWVAVMARHRVTLWNSVPAFAAMLADYLDLASDRAKDIPLRWMILAGDWIPVALPGRLRATWPGLDVIASGGPTETTIWDIWHRVDGPPDPDLPSIPYGKPLANATYHVVGRSGQPCPLWVPGELWIGGAGVTPGYLNQPALTAEKYIDDPRFGRVFRSGDMGRFLPDGSIEFLGRNDFQVKINGQRIELGEIEKVALSVDGVRTCAAVVRSTGEGRDQEAGQGAGQGQTLALFAVVDTQAPPAAGTLEEQEAAFAEQGVAVADPVQRLMEKLQYKALMPPAGDGLVPLAVPCLPRLPLRSHRVFAQETASPEALSEFLAPLKAHLDDTSGEAKFQYGSAGGIYPVQVYLYLKPGAVAGMASGFYRYYPLHHALTFIAGCELPDDIHWGYNRPMGRSASVYVYLIAATGVIEPQYGALAMPMCYLEAGMMSQRLRHAALETGWGVCSVGDINFPRYADLLGLAPDQALLTSMVAGPLPPPEEPAPAAASIEERLRAALTAALPRHMVPTAIVCLPALPLTGNGKIDRRSLMAMDLAPGASAAGAGPHVAAEGEVEEAIVAVLEELLGRSGIGVTDNFFDLGANSARLVKAHQAIQARVGTVFPLIAMFRAPTVRSLAAAMAGDAASAATATAGAQQAAASRAEKQKDALKALRNRHKTES